MRFGILVIANSNTLHCGKLRKDVELIRIAVDNDMSTRSLGVVNRIGYGGMHGHENKGIAHNAMARFTSTASARLSPEIQGLGDVTISSIRCQSISASNEGYSMSGGRDDVGVVHAVGGMGGNAVIGNGGTGSQRRRDCELGSADNGMSNESDGLRVFRGTGGRGRGPCSLCRCGRRICCVRFNSIVLEPMVSSYSSDAKRDDDCEEDDVFDIGRDTFPD